MFFVVAAVVVAIVVSAVVGVLAAVVVVIVVVVVVVAVFVEVGVVLFVCCSNSNSNRLYSTTRSNYDFWDVVSFRLVRVGYTLVHVFPPVGNEKRYWQNNRLGNSASGYFHGMAARIPFTRRLH